MAITGKVPKCGFAGLTSQSTHYHTRHAEVYCMEPPEIRIPPYYRHTAVVQFVSNLEGLHALILDYTCIQNRVRALKRETIYSFKIMVVNKKL